MSSTPKQPRKKRRVDYDEKKEIEIDPDFLPLVRPNQVLRSSKDPNRGLYPKTNTSNKRNMSCPTFSKASKLIKLDLKKQEKKTDSFEDPVPGPSTSRNYEIFDMMDNSNAASIPGCSKAKFEPPKAKKTTKSKFPKAMNFANKIINYFKPVQSSHKNTVKMEIDSDPVGALECSTSNVPAESPKTEVPPTATQSVEITEEQKNEEFFKQFENCYGLFGEWGDDDDDDRPNYFDQLPVHVLELIMCQIPFVDFMKNRLVCSQWNDVISDSKYMEWKKWYYKLKKGKREALDFMSALSRSYELNKATECFTVLLKFMSESFRRTPPSDMCALLTKAPKGEWAGLVLNERFPELLRKESKAWCLLTTAILLSETVEDISCIYKSLHPKNTGCSLVDLTDALYCIATFLFYYKIKYGLNHGLHYRLYNVLYWIENALPDATLEGGQKLHIAQGLPGQQSMRSYCDVDKSKLTYEQIRILSHCFQPGQIIKIVALAGTGKTTTLLYLAQLYPQVKFLNVMFNKAVCEEAKRRFPPNVTCRTAHSLAYAIHGNRLKHKLSSKIRPHDLVSSLMHHVGCQLHVQSYAKQVLITITSYANSKDTLIDLEHVPVFATEDKQQAISIMDRNKIRKDAQQVWKKMIDPESRFVRITHDVYLKLYQLSKPKLLQYQCLMVDEAQDCNPAMLDIMLSQNLPVILVGDPNQQIYGFRGARNALRNVESSHTYYLTKSFRFGPEISYVASVCLEVLKRNHAQTIVGSRKPSCIGGKVEGQYAIIARTNVCIFNEAIRMCCHKLIRSNEPDVVHGCFAGGLQNYGFDQMLDICKLAAWREGEPALEMKDRFISKFKTYKDLTSYVKCVEDSDLQAKIDLVNRHGQRIPEYIKIIKSKCSYSMSLANVVFTTAHRAKGLEFDSVCLTDDYQIDTGVEYRQRPRVTDSEESNVMYVALTRAKNNLLLPERLLSVLLAAQEKFEYPMPPSKVLNGQESYMCMNCNQDYKPHTTLVLSRRQIVLANGRSILGGALCMKCATEPKVRPRLNIEPVVMYLDPIPDIAHQAMSLFIGPLPNDPPIQRDNYVFQEMDVVYVINLNI